MTALSLPLPLQVMLWLTIDPQHLDQFDVVLGGHSEVTLRGRPTWVQQYR